MTRVIETTVYCFDELDESGKESARDWWRGCENTDFDTDFMYDDFEAIAKILGITFYQNAIPLMNGTTRSQSTIYWTGFSSQGDGACFDGYYIYAKGAAKAIRVYAPKDSTLHQIADDLQMIQRPAFYKLSATAKHSGRYYHAYSMSISVDHDDDRWSTVDEDNGISEALRDFASWMYHQLESEYEYRMSDENVDESIRINEYEFTESGSIA